MRCLLLKVFLVILTAAVLNAYGQEGIDPQALRFNDGAVNLYNAEKYAPAIEALDRALALEPNNVVFHYNLGMTYFKSGEFAKAATSFRRVTQLRPDYAVGYNQLGVSLMETRQDEAALEAFNAALRLKPDDAVMQFNAGCIHNRLKNFKKAAELLEKAAASKVLDDYADLHANLAYAHAMRKQYKRAIPEIRRAVEIDPAAVEPQYFLGILYLTTNDRDAAIRQQKVVESINPEIGQKLYREIYKDKLLVVSEAAN